MTPVYRAGLGEPGPARPDLPDRLDDVPVAHTLCPPMAPPVYEVGDRRPLASRQKPAAQSLARRLAQLQVSPNTISVGGLLFGILAGVLLFATPSTSSLPRRLAFLLAAGAVQLRLLCNLLDGMVAVEGGAASRVGELFNEIPDRISDAATLIGAGYAVGGNPTLGYVAACVALFVAYVRAMGKVAGAKQEFCGPMAKQHRMFVVTLGCVYCGLAPAGWQPLWGSAGVGVMVIVLSIIIVGGVVTAIRRLARITRVLKGPA